MNIGIDIDNVISNFDDTVLNEYLLHDKELRNNGIINKNVNYRRGMFDWTEEEENTFYENNIERFAKKLGVIEGAKEYIDKLHEDGHFIYIITGRDNGQYTDPYNITKDWLDNHDIYYDKLILTDARIKFSKVEKCIENHIDIIVDDSISICTDCIDNGITTILMDTAYNRYSKLKRAKNWKEIYKFISNYRNDKINLILDTDASNECDDLFALAYLLKSQDKFNIEAITIAPCSHPSKNITVKDGQKSSYNEILKICNMLNFNTNNRVFKGSSNYIQNGYNEDNDAVNRIIEVALKNDKTYILVIGAITNIALAIKKEPKIVNRIELVWLGGNELGYKDNFEYNFRQDIDAVKIVFESNVKLTILPCNNVISDLKIHINILRDNLGDTELDNYLIERFCNDGYHPYNEERIIFDIAVVAYMINKRWFKTKKISTPIINTDTSYKMTKVKNKITFVTKANRDKIYKDLFKKLKGDIYENESYNNL